MKRFAFLLALILCLVAGTSYAWENKLAWSFKPEMRTSGGMSIENNLMFIGDRSGKLYAIDINSGKVKWDFRDEEATSIVGTPAVVEKKFVVIAQSGAKVICLNIADGSEVWEYTSKAAGAMGENMTDGVAYGKGKIFFSKDSGKLTALNFKDGELLWEYQSKNADLRTAPLYSDNYIFLGEQGGLFSMINPDTGERVSGGGAGGPVRTPAVSGGNVYYTSWNGSVYAVKIAGTTPLWEIKTGASITTSPVIHDGKIFVGTSDGTVIALKQDNGETLWKFNTENGSIVFPPVAGDKIIFVASGQGNIFALDPETGKVKETVKLSEGADSFAYNNGILYYATRDGNICAVK